MLKIGAKHKVNKLIFFGEKLKPLHENLSKYGHTNILLPSLGVEPGTSRLLLYRVPQQVLGKSPTASGISATFKC